MKTNEPTKDLTDQMKKELREAKTKEELDVLLSSAGLELNDDELDSVNGGTATPMLTREPRCLNF